MFRDKFYKTSTLQLRNSWRKIKSDSEIKSFHDQVNLFYAKTFGKPICGPEENRELVNLWLMGFPLSVLKTHYILCAFRRGISRNGVSKKLGISGRTLHRV